MFNFILKILHKPIYGSRIKYLSQLIIPFIKKNNKILDVGCGFGELGYNLLIAFDK